MPIISEAEREAWWAEQRKSNLINNASGKDGWIGELLGSMRDWLLATVKAKGAKVTWWLNDCDPFQTEVHIQLKGRRYCLLMRPLFQPGPKPGNSKRHIKKHRHEEDFGAPNTLTRRSSNGV
jgi:hypothetical protein